MLGSEPSKMTRQKRQTITLLLTAFVVGTAVAYPILRSAEYASSNQFRLATLAGVHRLGSCLRSRRRRAWLRCGYLGVGGRAVQRNRVCPGDWIGPLDQSEVFWKTRTDCAPMISRATNPPVLIDFGNGNPFSDFTVPEDCARTKANRAQSCTATATNPLKT